MAKIMTKGNGLRQVFIEPQRPGDRPGCLRHLQCMRESRPVMISLRKKKNLGFVLQPPECLAVKDPVPVSLIDRTDIAGRLFPLSSSGFSAQGGIDTEIIRLPLFCHLTNVHMNHLSLFYRISVPISTPFFRWPDKV